jgi:digeranylgeranylglycerophospholipid reductase
MTDHDVLIVGAGPSGLQTARRLAERGLDVLVLEKKRRVGEAVNCTGLVGTDVFSRFGLSAESILRKVQDISLISPRGTPLDYHHPKCFAYVVDRERFDQGIGEEARAAGARIRTGTMVEDISQEADRVEIKACGADGEPLKATARMAVIATGVHQDLSRKLGLGRPKRHLFGAQVEVDVPDEEKLTIFAGTTIAAGGFAWAVPSRPGKAKFGLITDRDAKRSFRAFQEGFLVGKAIRVEENTVSYKPIAQGLASQTFGPRILAVGEAAGQVKTTTGGGVAFGLQGAEIAADVVARWIKNAGSEGGLAEYERLWKKELRVEILLGYYARRIWSRMTDAHIEKVFQFVRQDGVIPLIREKGDFDRQGELILALLRRFNLFGVLDGLMFRMPRLP